MQIFGRDLLIDQLRAEIQELKFELERVKVEVSIV